MSIINFPVLVDLPLTATPSSGYTVAYDLDGVLKQKDQFNVITPIGSTDQTLIDVLDLGNETGTYSIIMGTSTSIKSSNGGGQLDLDYSTSEVLLSTDNSAFLNQSQLHLTPNTVELSNLDSNGQAIIVGGYSQSLFDNNSNLSLSQNFILRTISDTNKIEGQFLSNFTTYGGLGSGPLLLISNGDNANGRIQIGVNSSLDSIVIQDNSTVSTNTWGTSNSASVIISSRSSSIDSGIYNSPVIGGSGITASVANTVYLGNSVNINNAYTLPSTDGTAGYVLKTNGSGVVSWGLDSATQDLKDVLFYGNNTETYNIIMGTATYIKSASNLNTIYLDTVGLCLTTNGLLTSSYIQLDNLGVTVSGLTLSISVTDSSITTTSLEGLKYSADYSATFVTQSLVSKKYVDDVVKNLNEFKTAYIDSNYGSDATGTIARFDKPYATVAAAMIGLTASFSSGYIYIRTGTYTETIYIQNDFDYYCEPGVIFTNGGFRDKPSGATSSIRGYATFKGTSATLNPLVAIYGSNINFEFDRCDNTYFFTRIDNSTVNIKGNYIKTESDNGFGLSIRGSSNVNIRIFEKILGGYKTVSVSDSFTGNLYIETPNIEVDTDIASFGYLPDTSVALFSENTTTGNITIKSNLSNTSDDLVYTILNPDSIGRFDSSVAIFGGSVLIDGKIDGLFTKGLYIGGTVSSGQVKVKGDISSYRETVVLNSTKVSAYLSEGTLKSWGSGSLPYVASVIGTASTLYVKDEIVWNTSNNSSMIYVFSTYSTVGLYDVVGYSTGNTGEFIYTTQSVYVGFHSVRSNKDNNILVTDLFGPSGFIYDTALFIPNF